MSDNIYQSGTPVRSTTLTIIAALALGTAAKAQIVAADIGDNEIVVTAQKRVQKASDVGITLSVTGSEALRERRIVEVANLPQLISNVSVKENVPGLVPVISIRGVGLNDFSATNSPSAGVYVDDVYLTSLALVNFNFFDLERLEILKGPQGTLYGRNATAGVINVLSAQPRLATTEGRIAGSVGNYASGDVEGMVNLPIGTNAALRFAAKGLWQGQGFWYDTVKQHDFGRRAELLGRAQLLWQPDETLKIVLKVDGQHTRSQLGAPEFFGLLPSTPPQPGVTCPGSPACFNFLGYHNVGGDPFEGAWSFDPTYHANQIATTARVEAKLGRLLLTSITAYINFNRSWGVDTDASPFAIGDFTNRDKVDQISQEFRLSGSTRLLTWIAGASYSHDRVTTSNAGNLPALFNTTTLTSSRQSTDAAALYGDLTWQLTDRLTLLTGGRYTHERRRDIGSTVDLVSLPPASFLSTAPFGSPPVTLAQIDAAITSNQWSWKAGLNWKPSSATLIYASATQGVKSGGFFAGFTTATNQLLPYRPETLVAYEIGIKQRLAESGLSLGASSFYYDYSNVQTFIRDTARGLPIQRLGNVDHASIYGVDLDASWNFVKGLDLNVGIGLLHSELGSFVSPSGPVPKGNRLPDAPVLSTNLGGSYRVELSPALAARVQVDARYTSRAFKDALNDPLIVANPFWVVNGRASLLGGRSWEVAVYAENLFDTRYVTQGVNLLELSNGFRVYGAPRTFGLSASHSF